MGGRLRPWRPIQFIVEFYRARERARRCLEPRVDLGAGGGEGEVEIDWGSLRVGLEGGVGVEGLKVDFQEGVKVEFKEEGQGDGARDSQVKMEVKVEEGEDEEWERALVGEMAALFKIDPGEVAFQRAQGVGLPLRLAASRRSE